MIESVDQLYHIFLECSGVSTDSRRIDPDCLFVALRGPNFNANEFAQGAIEHGARYALVDQEEYLDGPHILQVKDGLMALQQLAQHHRSQLKIPLIGITGSNGKTTTKELTFQVLSTSYKTMATQGNLNNHIGVPLTILSIKHDTEIAIIEMGANHIGEIARLCQIAQPTHGLITNIGQAHIEGFGGFDGVIRGKSELYQYLIKNGGQVFINSQDEILKNMAKRFEQPLFYPGEGDFLHINYTRSDPYLNIIGERSLEIETQLIGSYNFNNVAAALCVAKYFEVPTELAEAAVAEYVPTNNRSQVIQKGTNTLILDAYNANPSSMMAALENLLAMQSSAKTAILGDMMELGDESGEAHKKIVAYTRDGISQVLLCGPHMREASKMNPLAKHFNDRNELERFLKQNPIINSTILIKASRSMGLEAVADFI
ncbi:MAG: UDP-N-acetylmuramoyl-tripeptide--D-alanyl-D-alanine ligase [Bacteroidetes bacterium]|nr:MAG: UDP-N-acetylmuramoyl-tripeptide--D-alanyl-D-alanine ligase [Bacteroidota bacterium]